jgi:endothelin-converting enzyme/putative endopeptidase
MQITFKHSAIALILGASFLPCLSAFADEPPVAQATASVKPGDDFFGFANADWLAETTIPADHSSWGGSLQLAEDTNQRIVKMIEALGSDPSAKGEGRLVANFYAAYMDEAGIEAKGLAPVRPLLAKIDAIRDKAGLTRALGESLRTDVDVLNDTHTHTENLFGLWFAEDLNNPKHYVAYILQGGLGLPDQAYYTADSVRMADLRTKYQTYIADMLALAGYKNTAARAAGVMALEMALAKTHASVEETNDVLKANNPWKATDFAKNAPGMDWKLFFKAAQLGDQKQFILWHPGAIKGTAALVGATDIAAWKDWMAFHQLHRYADVLPKAFGELRFEFAGKTLSGTQQQSLRWKRALDATNAAMDEAVGHLYVDRYFPAENKLRIQEMVKNIVAAFSKRIDLIEWMSPATRAQAQQKLKTLYVGIGYPDKWQSFAGLKAEPGDAFGNVVRAQEFQYTQELAKLRGKLDPHRWCMPPHVINAVNMPMQNALNFPAAILQPPFFDPKGSDALNYGAIGATIGHEISHSFDDQGAQFDAQGRLRDWWTKEDGEHFKQASAALAAQYSAYKPFPDLAINGQQTLSENLSDLAGIAASFDAYKATLVGKANVPADADRQFFMGYAQSWREKTREAALRRQILTDGHAPDQYRSYTVRNLDAWYQAFDVQPGQALYLAPAERVRVW